MPISAVIQSIINFLRAGYPEGVPDTDYVPLLALLKRRLSDDEIKEVAEELVATSSWPKVTASALAAAIEAVTDQEPSESDIARVEARLIAGGWLDVDSAHDAG